MAQFCGEISPRFFVPVASMGPQGPCWTCHSFQDFFQRTTGISVYCDSVTLAVAEGWTDYKNMFKFVMWGCCCYLWGLLLFALLPPTLRTTSASDFKLLLTGITVQLCHPSKVSCSNSLTVPGLVPPDSDCRAVFVFTDNSHWLVFVELDGQPLIASCGVLFLFVGCCCYLDGIGMSEML